MFRDVIRQLKSAINERRRFRMMVDNLAVYRELE